MRRALCPQRCPCSASLRVLSQAVPSIPALQPKWPPSASILMELKKICIFLFFRKFKNYICLLLLTQLFSNNLSYLGIAQVLLKFQKFGGYGGCGRYGSSFRDYILNDNLRQKDNPNLSIVAHKTVLWSLYFCITETNCRYLWLLFGITVTTHLLFALSERAALTLLISTSSIADVWFTGSPEVLSSMTTKASNSVSSVKYSNACTNVNTFFSHSWLKYLKMVHSSLSTSFTAALHRRLPNCN